MEEPTRENLIANIEANLNLFKRHKNTSYLLTQFIHSSMNELIELEEESERLKKEAWDKDKPNRDKEIVLLTKRMEELKALQK